MSFPPPPPPPPGPPPNTMNGVHTVTVTTTTAVDQQHSQPKKRRKCGTPKGGKHVTHPQSDWYQLCLEYTKLQCEQEVELQMEEDAAMEGDEPPNKFKRRKLSQRQFLKQQTIVPTISGDQQSHVMTFSRNLKRFHAGTLENSHQKRSKSRQYEDIEQRLVAYITASASANTACTWEVMQEKCREWAAELGYDTTFKASAGWLHKTLKRHNLLQSAKKGTGENDTDNDDTEPLRHTDTHLGGTPLAQLPPILPTLHSINNSNNNNTHGGVNFCRNCPQWKQIHSNLTQEKNTAHAKIRRLEQQAQLSQKKQFELEKKLKLSQQEVQRLKGVVKVALKMD